MSFIIIYITHENEDEAKRVVKHLVEKRLVACGNIFPISSMYWWKGKIEDCSEFVSIVKTKSKNWEKVKGEIKKIHKYEVPCIMKFNALANKEYEDWINKKIS